MVTMLPVPQDELKRAAAANNTIVTIVQDLANLADQTGDTALADKLRADCERLLDSVQTIDSALRSAIYIAAA